MGSAALVAALLASTGISGAPARAQVTFSAVRALNLARNQAVQQNGGLSLYRPAQCMFQTADAGNECLLSMDEDGFVFRFLGGIPGWEQFQMPASVETEVRISADGRTVEEVLYNGPPRPVELAE
ncbi:hypothetical protein [Cyanobium sp. ATX 6A2]|uniref:hypothetical protein n=1 Tax=Cyanobium sp. ATX 6A2 TaxID=2823700 RepID=UPI0020CFB561|nr:hypothetical protein [Cyanobium sp. ATX 6A2]